MNGQSGDGSTFLSFGLATQLVIASDCSNADEITFLSTLLSTPTLIAPPLGYDIPRKDLDDAQFYPSQTSYLPSKC
jgi:hypothetical protein